MSLSRGERYADAARFVSGLSFADDEGYDWKASMARFRWGRRILESEAFKPFIKYEFMPGRKVQTGDELRTYIRSLRTRLALRVPGSSPAAWRRWRVSARDTRTH